jgi:hypothetical protein
MGGPNSGNTHNHRSGHGRTTVEGCLTLDANVLTRKGVLKPGCIVSGSWHWTFNGGRECSVGFTAWADGDSPPRMRLAYARVEGDAQHPEDYSVGLSLTRPTYGGVRWWFLCPLIVDGLSCGRRVAKLHLPPRARYFGCRRCHGLTYTSCQRSHKDDAITRRLAGIMGVGFDEAREALHGLNERWRSGEA